MVIEMSFPFPTNTVWEFTFPFLILGLLVILIWAVQKNKKKEAKTE